MNIPFGFVGFAHRIPGLAVEKKIFVAYVLMYVQFVHSALRNDGGGVQLVYESTCCLAWGLIFDRTRDRGVVCVISIFNAGGSVSGCVYTHTQTHYTYGVLGCEPRGRDETPGGRWTKSRHICIRICVQSTQMYVYARRRDLGLTAFFFDIFSSSKKEKQKI